MDGEADDFQTAAAAECIQQVHFSRASAIDSVGDSFDSVEQIASDRWHLLYGCREVVYTWHVAHDYPTTRSSGSQQTNDEGSSIRNRYLADSDGFLEYVLSASTLSITSIAPHL